MQYKNVSNTSILLIYRRQFNNNNDNNNESQTKYIPKWFPVREVAKRKKEIEVTEKINHEFPQKNIVFETSPLSLNLNVLTGVYHMDKRSIHYSRRYYLYCRSFKTLNCIFSSYLQRIFKTYSVCVTN